MTEKKEEEEFLIQNTKIPTDPKKFSGHLTGTALRGRYSRKENYLNKEAITPFISLA